MAEEMGISPTSLQRIWAEYTLKPHLVRAHKASNDPDFAVKVEDIIAPEKAPVRFLWREKSGSSPRPKLAGITLEEASRRNHDPLL